MTTATKTRPRKTAKKKSARKGKTKKPKWGLVTFKQIEGWRQKLGLSKSGMAEALQVTNSTYHNWRRGTTVPHPNQQKDILHRLQALEANASATGGGKKSSKPRGKRGSSNSSSSNGVRGRSNGTDGNDDNGTGDVLGASNGGSRSRLGRVSPGTRPSSPSVPRDDIAAITVAYIQSQKGTVSAGSVYEFVKGLREIL